MLTYFQKFFIKKELLKNQSKFRFFQKGGKGNSEFKKNYRIFKILLPKNIDYHEKI